MPQASFRRRKFLLSPVYGGFIGGVSTPGVSLPAPVLEWTSDSLNPTPTFNFDIPAAEVGDIATMRRSLTADFAAYEEASDTVDSIAPVNTLAFDFTPTNWADGTWYVKGYYTRAAVQSALSDAETVTIGEMNYFPPRYFPNRYFAERYFG